MKHINVCLNHTSKKIDHKQVYSFPSGLEWTSQKNAFSTISVYTKKILLEWEKNNCSLVWSTYLNIILLCKLFVNLCNLLFWECLSNDFINSIYFQETYKSFHYTSLLYLTDYGRDFQGGRFVFMDKDNVTRAVEPRKARVTMFTSGSENVHYVEKVTSGTRYALTVSFTCDPTSAISDPAVKTDWYFNVSIPSKH